VIGNAPLILLNFSPVSQCRDLGIIMLPSLYMWGH